MLEKIHTITRTSDIREYRFVADPVLSIYSTVQSKYRFNPTCLLDVLAVILFIGAIYVKKF